MGKRDDILNATKTLLAERGFYGISMKLIADTADMAAGTIYRYFENKETLITELYQQITLEMAQLFFNGWSEQQTLEEKYKLLWRNTFDAVRQDPQRTAVIEMLFLQPSLAGHEAAFCENDAFYPLIAFYQQGIDQGYFHNWQIHALITLSFDTAITLAKKITRKHFNPDEAQINLVRDASWAIIQKS
ncbi:MAG: TetR/AcrR family transcriptional regulator [Psychromonas sp.]